MNQAQMYVFYRLRGSGTVKAATLAGYSHGRPSPKARRLWKAARRIRHGVPVGSLDRYGERIVEKRKELAEMEVIYEVVKVVDLAASTVDVLVHSGGPSGLLESCGG